jgi:hypothetical protein
VPREAEFHIEVGSTLYSVSQSSKLNRHTAIDHRASSSVCDYVCFINCKHGNCGNCEPYETLIIASLNKKPWYSLPCCRQELATGSYSEPLWSNLRPQTLFLKTYFISYFSSFEKTKGGLCDHLSICRSACPLFCPSLCVSVYPL